MLALFDNDPAADLDRLGRLSPDERAQVTQASCSMALLLSGSSLAARLCAPGLALQHQA